MFDSHTCTPVESRNHPDNINRDNGIEIPEAWIPTIKKHKRRSVRQQVAEETTSNRTSQETTSHRKKTSTPVESRNHPDNINRDNGIEIPEAWIPTIKKHKRRSVRQQVAEETTSNRTSQETTSHRNNKVRKEPITANHRDPYGDLQPVDLIA